MKRRYFETVVADVRLGASRNYEAVATLCLEGRSVYDVGNGGRWIPTSNQRLTVDLPFPTEIRFAVHETLPGKVECDDRDQEAVRTGLATMRTRWKGSKLWIRQTWTGTARSDLAWCEIVSESEVLDETGGPP